MNEEKIKEKLSQHFVELIACRNGYSCNRPEDDYGCDLSINKVNIFNRNGDNRYLSTGEKIDIQLKSTCESNVEFSDTIVKYDLKSKNYNDLVERLSSPYPLILILFILPDDKTDWLDILKEELILKTQSFWFVPPKDSEETNNDFSKRIEIPLEQNIYLKSIDELFEEYLL